MSEFGRALRAAREAAGLSQKKLGLGAGTNDVYVRMLESGKRNPSPAMVERLAAALPKSARAALFLAAGVPEPPLATEGVIGPEAFDRPELADAITSVAATARRAAEVAGQVLTAPFERKPRATTLLSEPVPPRIQAAADDLVLALAELFLVLPGRRQALMSEYLELAPYAPLQALEAAARLLLGFEAEKGVTETDRQETPYRARGAPAVVRERRNRSIRWINLEY